MPETFFNQLASLRASFETGAGGDYRAGLLEHLRATPLSYVPERARVHFAALLRDMAVMLDTNDEPRRPEYKRALVERLDQMLAG